MRLAGIYQSTGHPLPERFREMAALADSLDPFELAEIIDRKLARIEQLQLRARSSASIRHLSAQPKTHPDAPRGVRTSTKSVSYDPSFR